MDIIIFQETMLVRGAGLASVAKESWQRTLGTGWFCGLGEREADRRDSPFFKLMIKGLKYSNLMYWFFILKLCGLTD